MPTLRIVLSLVLFSVIALPGFAQNVVDVTTRQDPTQPIPRSKEYRWMSIRVWNGLHEKFLKRTAQGDVELLFLGDSITQGWGENEVWQEYYGNRKAANFGIGGDTTQNVIWRLQNGEVDGISPKVTVLMIGTNNFGLHQDAPDDVVSGVTAVVNQIAKKLPDTKILLLAIFPRDQRPDGAKRALVRQANEQLKSLGDRQGVTYLDISDRFVEDDGTIRKELMPDFLHLSVAGYRRWAEAIEPTLERLLGTPIDPKEAEGR